MSCASFSVMDHNNHPLTSQNWKVQSSTIFMRFVLFGPKKEMNSYPTLQDEKIAVKKFLNRKVQEAMCCLDTQESSDNPSTTPDEVPNKDISNPCDQTVDQVSTLIRPQNMSIQPLSVTLLKILCVMLPKFYRLKISSQ